MILVVALTKDGALVSSAREAVAAASRLAAAGGELRVHAAVLGQGAEAGARALIACGAGSASFWDDPATTGQPDAALQALLEAVRAADPAVILMPHDDAAKDLGPKLAFRLGAGLTMDCIALSWEGGKVAATKPVYGGNALAVYEMEGPLCIATLRARAFEAMPDDSARQGSVAPLAVTLDSAKLKVRVVETRREAASAGMRLEDAPVVVAGGRGLGGAAAFQHLQALADVLGGAVGATRAVCDSGWVPHSMQVGLTGKTVAPNLYLAVGISGASQHMAGCAGARNIVAINRDRGSNIFREARYGAVGSWEEILPAFIATVKELRAQG